MNMSGIVEPPSVVLGTAALVTIDIEIEKVDVSIIHTGCCGFHFGILD